MIRVYDEAGNVIETRDHVGECKVSAARRYDNFRVSEELLRSRRGSSRKLAAVIR